MVLLAWPWRNMEKKKKENWIKRFLNWIAKAAEKQPPQCGCGKNKCG